MLKVSICSPGTETPPLEHNVNMIPRKSSYSPKHDTCFSPGLKCYSSSLLLATRKDKLILLYGTLSLSYKAMLVSPFFSALSVPGTCLTIQPYNTAR